MFLHSFRMGTGCQIHQSCDQRVETFSPSLGFKRLSASPMDNDLVNHTSKWYLMGPLKTCKQWGSKSFWVGKHITVREGWHTWRGHRSFLSFLLYLALYIPSIWLLLSSFFDNRPIIVFFSLHFVSPSSKLSNLRRGCENPLNL